MDTRKLPNERPSVSDEVETGDSEAVAAEIADKTSVEVEQAPANEKKAGDQDTSKKAASAKRLVMCIMSIATLLMAFGNIRVLSDQVSNVGSSIYRSLENIFYFDTKSSSNGCTVEILETDVANDFLYLTVKESYNKKSILKNDDTLAYTLPDIFYSGWLRSRDGDAIYFDSNNFLYLQYSNDDYMNCGTRYNERTIVGMDDAGYKKSGKFTVNAKYKIYIPGLMSFMNESSERYICSLNASSERTGSDIGLKFPLYDFDDVIHAKNYFFNHSVDVNEVKFVFDQIQVTSHNMDAILEWDAPNDADYVPGVGAELKISKTGSKENAVILNTHMENNSLSAGNGAAANAAQEDVSGFPSYLKIGGKCYLIVSDYVPIDAEDVSENADDAVENVDDDAGNDDEASEIAEFVSAYDYLGSDLTVEIQDIYCDYSGLVQNNNELADIVLSNEKEPDTTEEAGDSREKSSDTAQTTEDSSEIVTDNEFVSDSDNADKMKPEQEIVLGDVTIKLGLLKMLNPAESNQYSNLGFDGSLEYSGEANLVYWQGYMDLINPVTNQTAKFSIQYYHYPEEYGSLFHVDNGLRIASYYMADPIAFLDNFSGWHIASVTEVASDFDLGNDQDFSRTIYGNKWTNPSFANVRVSGLHGRKVIRFLVPAASDSDAS